MPYTCYTADAERKSCVKKTNTNTIAVNNMTATNSPRHPIHQPSTFCHFSCSIFYSSGNDYTASVLLSSSSSFHPFSASPPRPEASQTLYLSVQPENECAKKNCSVSTQMKANTLCNYQITA